MLVEVYQSNTIFLCALTYIFINNIVVDLDLSIILVLAVQGCTFALALESIVALPLGSKSQHFISKHLGWCLKGVWRIF